MSTFDETEEKNRWAQLGVRNAITDPVRWSLLLISPLRDHQRGMTSLDAILTHGRLTSADGCRRLFEQLNSLNVPQQLSTLTRLEACLSISPHNRNVCAGPAGLVNAVLAQLPQFEDPECRSAALRIVRQLGRHRFTVHNMRSFLAAIQQNEAMLRSASSHAMRAGTEVIELIGLLVDIIAGSADPTEPAAFWDMAVGVMGATGFDLPADRIVMLVSKGSFTLSTWLRLEQLPPNPTVVFAVVDGHGDGLQLQLHRAGAGIARAELVITEPKYGSTATRMLGVRLGGAGHGGGVDASSTTAEFGADAVIRIGSWHLLTLSCRRSSLLSLAVTFSQGLGGSRDEALLSA